MTPNPYAVASYRPLCTLILTLTARCTGAPSISSSPRLESIPQVSPTGLYLAVKHAPGRKPGSVSACTSMARRFTELFAMFPDDKAAEAWFEAVRWPNGKRFCPDCGSVRYAVVTSRKPMPYRCKDCRQYFSVRKGTVMQSSKLGCQKWVIAICMMATNLKGTSSMKLHRDLGVRQATAWHMMQRIRPDHDRVRPGWCPRPTQVASGQS